MSEELTGGRFASPVRQGREVIRRPPQDNGTIRMLLQHFEQVGCNLTPRFLGLTADGADGSAISTA